MQKNTGYLQEDSAGQPNIFAVEVSPSLLLSLSKLSHLKVVDETFMWSLAALPHSIFATSITQPSDLCRSKKETNLILRPHRHPLAAKLAQNQQYQSFEERL